MFSFKRLIKFGLLMGLLGIIALITLYLTMRDDLPSVESLKNLQWQTPMQIYSNDGKLMSQFGEKKRIPLALEEMPQQLIDAILATEDDRFYQHFGIDPVGLTRAVIGQIIGQNKGGGSTITMQVARNFFLTREVTYVRKLREIFISFHIENLLTKDEILALYMNKIPLGHRSYGFGAAAQVYYGKEVHELTLAQIAVLAGLPKAPSTLNPIRSPKRAKARRSVVLQRMLAKNYITPQEYQEAMAAPITGKRHGAEIELNAPYLAEMAHQEMLQRYGREQAYTGGYKVFTTVPSKLQKAAQHAVVTNLMAYDQRHGYRGVIRSLRNENNNKPDAVTGEYSKPLTPEEIDQALNIKGYQSLEPAIVTGVFEQSVAIALKNEQQATIDWPGLSWAREYISDQKQGPAPQTAADILNYGDVVWVLKQEDDSFALSQIPQVSGALVSISPDDGAIKAAVGGFSFNQSQFNRVTQAKRQVGSNIKPFIYSAALENGFTLASIINDAPINQWDRSSGVVWRPKNSPPTYVGPIRIRLALAQSKNVISVRLLREVGLGKIIDHLSLFGFVPDELPRNETLALGSASLTPLEVASGFATFANGGFLIQPYLIDRIEDSFGNIVFQASPAVACDPCQPGDMMGSLSAATQTAQAPEEPDSNGLAQTGLTTDKVAPPLNQAERVISKQNAFLMTEALNSAIWGYDWSTKPGWQGTGFRAKTLKRRDIAGKTGTTNESKDAWFSGYSRRLVTTSWIGFDDHTRNLGKTAYNKNLGKSQVYGIEAGAKSAQPAWITYMDTALEDLEIEPFLPPEDVVSVRIDKATGKLSSKADKTSLFEYFENGTAPTEYVTLDKSREILDGNEDEEIDEELF
ncbi:penicillin-binding protein 1A [Thalassomonas viridans]|uniref:Penicillin-binding protein 1A n=1 Tax=Thalassomonas viridans TaxID=137584 RepID=A0AAF0C913_9GAMM|nr:penicillin-binding protein 1A [Thalassomonas viridans]WDE04755.1 penicillin-binding protein 1A [Thalassomonas viridans]